MHITFAYKLKNFIVCYKHSSSSKWISQQYFYEADFINSEWSEEYGLYISNFSTN